MKYYEKIGKPIPFLEDWSWDDEEQWRFLWETRWVWEWRTNKTMNSKKCSRENWKVLKTVLRAQNTHFSWRYQVVYKSPNTLETRFWKFCLSVFRDWEVHPQGSHEGSHENFCITSRLELPLAIKSPNQVMRTFKQNFENFLSLFHEWDIDLPLSRENLLCKLATRACDSLDPRPSRQNRATLFFDIFTKTKDFPKTIKTLKNLFMFGQQKLSMWNTFKQVQSHKWIRHSLSINMCDVCGYQNWDSP